MSQKSVEAVNNFINGELNPKEKSGAPVCTVTAAEKETDTSVCTTGTVKEAVNRLSGSHLKEKDEKDDKLIPKLPPPDKNKKEIKDKGWLIVQIAWLLVQIIPAILYSIYKTAFPGPGKSLRGKVALVTGAARGLGRGYAIALSREGCKVACVDIDMVGCEETVKLIKEEQGIAKAYKTNVGRIEDVRELHKKVNAELGPVHYLVNNASLIAGYAIDDPYDIDKQIAGVVNVNLLSHFWMIRTFLPDMRKQKGGHVVGIASMSSFAGLAYGTGYVACKWALRGLMESVRAEMRKEGEHDIHFTCVHPYFINTSAEYTSSWKIRFPELTIEEVVEKTMEGIKHNTFSVCIPSDMYYSIHLSKFLPRYIQDQFSEIFYADIKVPSKDRWEKLPSVHIIKDTLK